jgi:hypothetical protein
MGWGKVSKNYMYPWWTSGEFFSMPNAENF